MQTWDTGSEPVFRLLARLASGFVRAWVDLRVVGTEHVPGHGPVVLAANHVSYFDPVALGAVLWRCERHVRFLALADLFQRPAVGWVLRRGRMIPVVRGGGPERMVAHACAALEAGEAVLVYPEGRIVPPGKLVRARPGAGLLALRTLAPVVPIASAGLSARTGPGLPRFRSTAAVVVGPPVDLSLLEGRDDPQAWRLASALVLGAVRSLQPTAQALAAGRAIPPPPAPPA